MVAVDSVIQGRITKPFRRLLTNAGVMELNVHAIVDPGIASDALDSHTQGTGSASINAIAKRLTPEV